MYEPGAQVVEHDVHEAALAVVEKFTPAWQGVHVVMGFAIVHWAPMYVPAGQAGHGRHRLRFPVMAMFDANVRNPTAEPIPS
jgi:hypothetical protein